MSEKIPDLSNDTRSWWQQVKGSYRTPLGMIGVGITTVFFMLSVLGLIAHSTGMVQNSYAVIITFFLFPSGMLFGLLLTPLAIFMGRRKMFSKSLTREGFIIDLGNQHHRRTILLILVLSVVNIALFTSVTYEGYRFMDTSAFCGLVCHTVMAPEYTAHARSPHANVDCVECHIGPGVGGFLKAKTSGLRQLQDVLTGDYSRPIPTPVAGLPPAILTCEKCHAPERFFGDVKKTFTSFSNNDQEQAQKQDILIHLGGRDPITGSMKGIHWHAGHTARIEYQALDEKRTKIGAIRVIRSDGASKLFTKDSKEADPALPWRRMDCTDCHNRPTHIFDNPERRVDFGLSSKKIHPEIPGIRQDSLTVLRKQYGSRADASAAIVNDLKKLQETRNGSDFVSKNDQAIMESGAYVKEVYLDNIWPSMKVTWGTYKSQIGHQDTGYGCFRCHDEEHVTGSGETISQDCDLCHKSPD